MATIVISAFAGLAPELNAKLAKRTTAQVAHNCLLWDGSLRPMPKWTPFKQINNATNNNCIYEDTTTLDIVSAYDFEEAVYLDGPPFATRMLVGIDHTPHTVPGYNSNLMQTEGFGSMASPLPLGLPTPTFTGVDATITAAAVSYESMLFSQKPVNRIVGVTFCRVTQSGLEESTIGVIPGQAPFGIMFEGDIVEVDLTLNLSALTAWGVTHIRLYRTISGLTSGEQVGNELDTDWHLVDTLEVASSIVYRDGGAVTTDPMDLYLAGGFYPPSLIAQDFGRTEGGWFYATSSGGEIRVSERYLHYAWPTENRTNIPEQITDAVAKYDTLYIGTNTKPYLVAIAPGEGERAVQIAATPFADRLPCLPGSMTAGPSGSLYASPRGLVALSKSGPKILTGGLTNAGDNLYNVLIDATLTTEQYREAVKIQSTVFAAYHNGAYYGFVAGKEVPLKVV